VTGVRLHTCGNGQSLDCLARSVRRLGEWSGCVSRAEVPPPLTARYTGPNPSQTVSCEELRARYRGDSQHTTSDSFQFSATKPTVQCGPTLPLVSADTNDSPTASAFGDDQRIGRRMLDDDIGDPVWTTTSIADDRPSVHHLVFSTPTEGTSPAWINVFYILSQDRALC